MKQLARNEDVKIFSVEDKKKFYQHILQKGTVQAHWNSRKYQNKIKNYLAELSESECAFCGIYLRGKEFDIEHFLPKSIFPYLSYSEDNYLPSCTHCNQRLKRAFYSKSLEHLKDFLVDKDVKVLLVGGIEYQPRKILKEVSDRLIEPSYDLISEHLEFEPTSATYKNITEIGRLTNEMFFCHRERIEHLQRISNQIRKLILEGLSKEEILDLSKTFGYGFYFAAFYEFWSEYLNIDT